MHPTRKKDLTYTVLSKRRQAGFISNKECTLYSIVYIKFKSRQKQFKVIEVGVIITREEEEVSGMGQRVGSTQPLLMTYFLTFVG